MKRFLLKLNPLRPSFAQDMTEAERKVMQEHVSRWKDLAEKGIAVVFGPVLDPRGARRVGIVEVADEADARDLVPNDPVIKAGLCTIEVYPMGPGTIVRK